MAPRFLFYPPARAFYSCPNWKLGRGCDFLQWADARQDLSGFATPMAKVDALIWVSNGGK